MENSLGNLVSSVCEDASAIKILKISRKSSVASESEDCLEVSRMGMNVDR